ncbi:MAG: ATP-binding protein [Saprospirales bacterium]|nr:ATP-binding protein [Saprospirales bacterium]
MQKRYPFKFLNAYTREDRDIFFGRTEEIDALYEMVFQTDLLLIYGASGTGKTSLIQCGLASKFQSHDWLALNIRRGSNLNDSFEKALQEAGGALDTGDEDLDWLDEDLLSEGPAAASKALSPLARRFKAIYLKHFKPLYLLFDQFEELYILGSKTEQQQFIDTIREIMRVEQPVKIILSIREEYLGHLYEFERQVPELLRKKLRVEPMNLDKVKTVIQGVGSLPQSNVHLQAGEEETLAVSIFEKIRGEETTLTIPLPYLQVFLDKFCWKPPAMKSARRRRYSPFPPWKPWATSATCCATFSTSRCSRSPPRCGSSPKRSGISSRLSSPWKAPKSPFLLRVSTAACPTPTPPSSTGCWQNW